MHQINSFIITRKEEKVKGEFLLRHADKKIDEEVKT